MTNIPPARLNPEALNAAYAAYRAHAADPGRKGSGIEKAISAYLVTELQHSRAAEAVEPVAWRVRISASEPWSLWDIKPPEDGYFDDIEPLYSASPASPSPAAHSGMTSQQAAEFINEQAAQSAFTEYFVKNYPGPHTVIGDPNWHAPKIFRAALYAIKAALVEQP